MRKGTGMARWLLVVVFVGAMSVTALPGCSGEQGPKLDTSKSNPGFNAPIRGGKPGEKPQRPVGA